LPKIRTRSIVIRRPGFGGHIPTSTSVEVTRMATDESLRLEIHVVAAAPAAD
jgi:hypothetical protein